MRGQLPRPYLKIKEGEIDTVTVSGLEVVAGLNTSQTVRTNAVGINPARADIFPRLSAFALQYERFRFKRLRLHYYTTCPATRSGSVGIAIHTEYTPATQVNTSYAQFAAYQYSAIGAVSESMCTPVWDVKDPEWFYIGSGTLAQDDILKVFQGSLVGLTADAVAADAGLIAGYIAVEYEVSFRSFRPTPQRVSCISDQTDVSVTGGGASVVPCREIGYDASVFGQAVGYFDHRQADDVLDSTTLATLNSGDVSKELWSGVKTAANWIFDYYFTTAALAESLRKDERKQAAPSCLRFLKPSEHSLKHHKGQGKPLKLKSRQANLRDAWDDGEDFKVRNRRSLEISGFYNPEFIHNPPTGYTPYPDDALAAGIDCLSVLKAKSLLPEAAGDLTVTWNAYSPLGKVIYPIISDVVSSGTGALTLADSHLVYLPEDYSVAFLTITPTGTEVRNITANTQTLSALDE
jgi:hypothetical protein